VLTSVHGVTGLLSKVSQAVQSLNIDNAPHTASQQGSQHLATSPDSVLQTQSPRAYEPSAQNAAEQVQSKKLAQVQQTQDSNGGAAAVAGGEDEWQRASSSHNAARKKKRKQQRRSAMRTAGEPTEAEPVSSAHPTIPEAQITVPDSAAVSNIDQHAVSHSTEDASNVASHDSMTAAAEVAVSSSAGDHMDPHQSHAHSSAAPSVSASSSQTAEGDKAQSESSQGQSADSGSDRSETDSGSEEQYSDDESEPESEEGTTVQSSVASVTADFAMQNVILQMGLRLVAPNGMRIKQLSRWVLRCSACFKITKVSSLACGNCPLDVCTVGSMQHIMDTSCIHHGYIMDLHIIELSTQAERCNPIAVCKLCAFVLWSALTQGIS